MAKGNAKPFALHIGKEWSIYTNKKLISGINWYKVTHRRF